MLAAIRREPCRRVPTDIWATDEVWDALCRHVGGDRGAVMRALHIDGVHDVGARYIGPPLPAVPEDEQVDYWGIRNRKMHYPTGFYWEQCHYPLARAKSVDDLAGYAWPTTDWFDYSGIETRARGLGRDRAVACGYMAPFYYHNLLRGLEQSLLYPHDDPELTHAIVGRISDFFYEHHRRCFEAARGTIDLAQVTDDYGSQIGPLISPETFRRFYRPQLQRFIDLCHEFGIAVFHHDDGAIRPFLPELVEMGIDVLNPVQHTCPGMEMAGLKRDFGQRLCFHGAIDNQHVLPRGSPEDVRRAVREAIDTLASDRTGYILAPCHDLQAVTPVENIVAMYDEAWRYGRF
jgi:uroporphyrinogen decarboxylase